jgi:uncharacterized integral membrane protein (TIGR00698 family)
MTPGRFSLPLAASRRLAELTPGVLLCVVVSAAAWALQGLQLHLFGRAWFEALALAIVLGAAVRTAWTPGRRWTAGIDFSARALLETAVLLLGATMDAHAIAAEGPLLLAGTAALVALGILSSYGLGRLFRLPQRMALLIACGNSICGNSAIAAVAPVIGAEGDEVAAAISFTAVLCVGVVLGLPALGAALGFGPRAFGVFAGLTVYAVPQVLAATAPVSLVSAQVGTLVKLLRVLLLGPVVAALSLLGLDGTSTAAIAGSPRQPARARLRHLLPWFIVGFGLLVALRSAGALPPAMTAASGSAATALTIVSMAALGLGVDVRALLRAGPRASAVVSLSLVVLGALAWALVRALSLA